MNNDAIGSGALGGVTGDRVTMVQVLVLAAYRSSFSRVGSDIDVPRRVDTFDFPELPIREA
jgi:hypothetical protein